MELELTHVALSGRFQVVMMSSAVALVGVHKFALKVARCTKHNDV